MKTPAPKKQAKLYAVDKKLIAWKKKNDLSFREIAEMANKKGADITWNWVSVCTYGYRRYREPDAKAMAKVTRLPLKHFWPPKRVKEAR